ncbi:MAG: LacI family DNA-binding transcriptional regulator [Candidatus Devosia euplotis]|nr:LacI family DNA-binding transcriptional regulator [Candidatus Devosia euplotis]
MSEDDLPAEKGKRGVKPSGKPTLKTIAQMTGFAVTTISRALNNAPELSQDTRDRVQKVASEVGYLPDRAALRLKTGRTNVIALALEPDEQIYGFGNSIMGGLSEALRGTAYHLVITPLFRNVASIEPVKHIVRNRMADGGIFSKPEAFDERTRFLIDSDFPFVNHGRSNWREAHPWVDFNEFAANVNLGSAADVIRSYVIKRSKRPDGPYDWVCASEVSALAVISGISEAGLKVGRDVHVATKQSSQLFAQFQLGAETAFEDFVDAGRQLGSLLLRRIGGETEGLQYLAEPVFDWKD